jgi:hypothetical protein
MEEYLMRRKLLLLSAMVAIVGGTVAYSVAVDATTTRPDCPGTIACPLTGEQVCADQCPLRDAERSDCPGKVVCPLTGELVCRDQCPVGNAEDGENDEAVQPPCCRQAK